MLRARPALAALVLGLAACSSQDPLDTAGDPDASADAPAALGGAGGSAAGGAGGAESCRGLKDQWRGLLAANPGLGACSVSDDCRLAAYPYGGGAPSVSESCGVAVNRQAYEGSEAANVEERYLEACPNEFIFDCGPGTPFCRAGRCELEPWHPPDAGPEPPDGMPPSPPDAPTDAGPLGPGRDPSLPTLYLQPADGTTALGAGALGARLVGNISRATAEGVAAAFRLRTTPEGAAVPFDTSIDVLDGGGVMEVRVKPRAPLDNRWYLLDLATKPAGIEWPAFLDTFVATDGARGTRFRAGSQPTIRLLRLCEKAAGHRKLTVQFSEPVGRPGDGSPIVHLGFVGDEKTPVPCTPLPLASPLGQVDYDCQPFARKVIVAGYLRSADGRTQMGPASATVDPAELTPVETGCAGAFGPLEIPGTGACLPGATSNDCNRCGKPTAGAACVACPKVDCSVFPPPPECLPRCSSPACCACSGALGGDQWLADTIRGCGTVCRGFKDQWKDLLAADPALRACSHDDDCRLAAYPYGNGAPSVSESCGVAVNRKAYDNSPAATVEQKYLMACPNEIIFDCGPGTPHCRAGRCELEPWHPPDGGGWPGSGSAPDAGSD